MNNKLKGLSFLLFFCLLLGLSQDMDTVIVYETSTLTKSNETQFYYPGRSYCSTSNFFDYPQTIFIDSIRVSNIIINKYLKKYYLKSYDKDSVLRLEGDFFDCYPGENIVEYSDKGDTITFGDYKISKYKKPKVCLKSKNSKKEVIFPWKTKYYTHKNGEWITFDKQRNKRNQSFYDIPNKRIRKVFYRMNLGTLKKIETVEKIKKKNYILSLP